MLSKKSAVSLPQRPPQGLVEVREHDEVGRHRGQVAQVEPLGGEIGDQRLRARVGQHPAHVRFEHAGISERPGGRRLDQRVVRQAAPEEETRAGRPAPDRSRGYGRSAVVGLGIALHAQQELGADQQASQRHLDAGTRSRRRHGPGGRTRPAGRRPRRSTGRRYARRARVVRESPSRRRPRRRASCPPAGR